MKKLVVLVLILSLGCIGQGKTYTGEENLNEDYTEEESQEEDYTAEESLEIAQNFVLDSPTYMFDGEGLKHVETITLRCPSCWQFVFEFTCRHGGFGNRSKQMVTQVMTHHTAEVTVENGKVTYAVLDGKWDIINQELIE